MLYLNKPRNFIASVTIAFTNQVRTHIKLYICQATVSETSMNISHILITAHNCYTVKQCLSLSHKV